MAHIIGLQQAQAALTASRCHSHALAGPRSPSSLPAPPHAHTPRHRLPHARASVLLPATAPDLTPAPSSPPPPAPAPAPPTDPAATDALLSAISTAPTPDALLDALSTHPPAALTPRAAAKSLNTLAKLAKRLPTPARLRLTASPTFAALLAALPPLLPDMTPKHLANTFHALGSLAADPPPTLLTALKAAATARLPALNFTDAAMILYGVAAMGHQPSSAWTGRLCVHALSLLQPAPTPAATPADTPPTSPATPNGTPPAATAAAAATGDDTPPAAPSTTDDDTPATPVAAAAAAPRDPIPPLSVAMCLWALASTGAATGPPKQLITGLSTWLAKGGGARLPAASLATTAWSLAKLGRCPPQLLHRATSPRTWLQLQPQEQANVLWACCASRYEPDGLLGACTAAAQQLERWNGTDVSMLVYAMATFGLKVGEEGMAALGRRVAEVAGAMAPMEACLTFWGLALLQHVHGPWTQVLADAVQKHYERGVLQRLDGVQVYQGYAMLQAAEATVDLPDDMLATLGAWWREEVARAPEQGTARSTVLAELGDALRRLRVDHKLQHVARGGVAAADVAVRLKGAARTRDGQRFLALQVVGDNNCAANTGKVLGGAQVERLLLARAGWEVKVLKAVDYLAIPAERRGLFVVELVKSWGFEVGDVEHLFARPLAGGSGGGKGAERGVGGRGAAGEGQRERQKERGWGQLEGRREMAPQRRPERLGRGGFGGRVREEDDDEMSDMEKLTEEGVLPPGYLEQQRALQAQRRAAGRGAGGRGRPGGASRR